MVSRRVHGNTENTYSPWKERLADFVGEQFPIWDTRENRITLQKSDKFIELAIYFTNDEKFMNTVGKKNKSIVGLDNVSRRTSDNYC